MQSLSDDERRDVLGEVLSDELKAITEYVKDVPLIKRELQGLKDDVSELKADMKIVKAAITDLSHQQRDHEHRISRLETT